MSSYSGVYEVLFPSEKVVKQYTGKTTPELLVDLAKKKAAEAEARVTEAAREEVRKQAAEAEKRITEEARKEAGAGAFSGVLLVGAVGLGLWFLLRKR